MKLIEVACLVLIVAIVFSFSLGCQSVRIETQPTATITQTSIQTLQTMEKEAPRVILTTPLNGSMEVSVSVVMEIRFSVPMNKEITAQALIISPTIKYDLSWGKDGMSMFISPLLPLNFETFYMVTLTAGAQAENGLHLERDCFFSFSSETTPGA